MGQKVNPTGFRVGITEPWRSRWYAEKRDYGRFLVQDQKIRRHIKRNYSFAGIPEVEIGGVHELVGNALVMEGENERETNLRGEPIPMPPSESPPEAEPGEAGEAGEGEGETNV